MCTPCSPWVRAAVSRCADCSSTTSSLITVITIVAMQLYCHQRAPQHIQVYKCKCAYYVNTLNHTFVCIYFCQVDIKMGLIYHDIQTIHRYDCMALCSPWILPSIYIINIIYILYVADRETQTDVCFMVKITEEKGKGGRPPLRSSSSSLFLLLSCHVKSGVYCTIKSCFTLQDIS